MKVAGFIYMLVTLPLVVAGFLGAVIVAPIQMGWLVGTNLVMKLTDTRKETE